MLGVTPVKQGLHQKKEGTYIRGVTPLMRELKKNKILFLMLIPALVYILIFNYIPLSGLLVAFKKYTYADGIFGSPWVGLDNFKFFFMSGEAWTVTRNTLVFNTIFLVVGTIFDVLAAVLVSEMSGKYFKRLCQSFMFLPFFMSWVIVGSIVYNMFNYEYGVLNTILRFFHIQPIDVYNMPKAWYFILPAFSIWKNIGYNSIIYITAIMGINPEIKEAAEIDGANIFLRIRHITIPHLKPTIIIMTLLAVGRILRGNFEMFYQLVGTSSRLFEHTDIIDTYVFRSMISGTDFGMVSAAAFYQSILCFVIIVFVNWCVKKYEPDYALF